MINLLGPKIVLVIILATLVFGMSGAASYYYMIPQMETAKSDEMRLRGQISTKRDEIRQLKIEYVALKDQILKFNLLKKKGFFNAQDRVTARDTISQLTAQAKLLRADLNLSPAQQITDNKNASDAGYVLISGPMSIKIGSLNDINIFKYMVALQNVFPGYLEFKSFSFTRQGGESQNMLQGLMDGNPEPLIEGELQFTWWSMASPLQMEASPYLNPGAVMAPAVPGQPGVMP